MARLLLIVLALTIAVVHAEIQYFSSTVDAQQAGNLYDLPWKLGGRGNGWLKLDTTASTIECAVFWNNKLSANVSAAHIHNANTGAIIWVLTIDNAQKNGDVWHVTNFSH